MTNLVRSKQNLFKTFNFNFCSIDTNRNYFTLIYPPELEIKATSKGIKSVKYFNLCIKIKNDLTSKLVLRRDAKCSKHHFSSVSTNIPSAPVSNVCIE